MQLAIEFGFKGSSRLEAYDYLNNKFADINMLYRIHPALFTAKNQGYYEYIVQDLRHLKIAQIFDLFANPEIYKKPHLINSVMPFIIKHAKLNFSNKNEYDEETRIKGTLALDHAIRYSRKITEFLLKLGANPNKITPNVNAPLHFAVCYSPDLIPLLLEYGADVNALGASLDTPLHLAICYKKADSLKILLENKADPNKLFENKISPLRLATFKKWDEGISLLKAYLT